MVGSATTENYLRARLKMKVFDGQDAESEPWSENNPLADDRIWLEKLVASEKEPVEFQLKDGSWLQTSTHPIHGGGRVYLQGTDSVADEVQVGAPVELTFRRLHEHGGKRNYFWKARPV